MNNDSIRRKFNNYYEEFNHPSMNICADKIGITRAYLVDFKNGKRNVGPEVLKKISNFVDNYQLVGM